MGSFLFGILRMDILFHLCLLFLRLSLKRQAALLGAVTQKTTKEGTQPITNSLLLANAN